MSYCRWSSMDFQCDLYVFDYCNGGTAVYVAGRRRKVQPGKTLPPSIGAWYKRGEEGLAEYQARERAIREAYGQAEDWRDPGNEAPEKWTILPEPHAGQCYMVATHEEAARLVEALRAAGFIASEGLEADLRAEPDCACADVE